MKKKSSIRSAHTATLTAKRHSGAAGPHRKGGEKKASKYKHAWRRGETE